jgi:excisionase family DNA binding protein
MFDENVTKQNHLLNGREVAEILNISLSFAFKMIRTGKIPAVRIGRSVRVRPSDLGTYIENNLSKCARQSDSSSEIPTV